MHVSSRNLVHRKTLSSRDLPGDLLDPDRACPVCGATLRGQLLSAPYCFEPCSILPYCGPAGMDGPAKQHHLNRCLDTNEAQSSASDQSTFRAFQSRSSSPEATAPVSMAQDLHASPRTADEWLASLGLGYLALRFREVCWSLFVCYCAQHQFKVCLSTKSRLHGD